MLDAFIMLCRVACIVSICALGAWLAWITNGYSGIAWAVCGSVIIWVWGQG